MLLMQEFPGRGIARALVVLPWAVPVSLATLAWQWMFDSLYSVINWTLVAAGLVDVANHCRNGSARRPGHGRGHHRACLAAVPVRRGDLPRRASTSVPEGRARRRDRSMARASGGGTTRSSCRSSLPIVLIALIFGTVFTFTDMSVVYLLTKGGPDQQHAGPGLARLPGRHPVGRRRARRGDLPVPVPVPAGRGDRAPARAAPPGDLR